MPLSEEVVVLLDLDEDNLLLGSKGGVVTKEERLPEAKYVQRKGLDAFVIELTIS